MVDFSSPESSPGDKRRGGLSQNGQRLRLRSVFIELDGNGNGTAAHKLWAVHEFIEVHHIPSAYILLTDMCLILSELKLDETPGRAADASPTLEAIWTLVDKAKGCQDQHHAADSKPDLPTSETMWKAYQVALRPIDELLQKKDNVPSASTRHCGHSGRCCCIGCKRPSVFPLLQGRPSLGAASLHRVLAARGLS
jgi:hypothetical protein